MTTFTGSDGGSDTKPPWPQRVSLNPTSLDIQAGQTTLLVTAHITDDLSGFSDGSILFVGPSGQKVSGMFDLVSGDRLDGVYQASITLGANAGAGTWVAQWLFLGDEANNQAVLSWFDFSSALATTTFTVSNDGGDGRAASLETVSLSTASLEIQARQKMLPETRHDPGE